MEREKSSPWRILVPVLCFVVVVALIVFGVGNVAASAHAEQQKIMERAIRRAAVQCYAIEGRYPPDLAYLEEHYGLILDESRYVYHYRQVGDNLTPEISVFSVDEG